MASCFHPIDVFQKSLGKSFLVPCNKCAGCLERKRQMFMLRAQYAMRKYNRSYFVTLTYDDAHLPYESFTQKSNGSPVNPICTGESVLCPYDLRLFFERFRHFCGVEFEYLAAGEYGDENNTRRPHFHICLFIDLPWSDVLDCVRLAWSRLRPETPKERYQRYKKSKELGLSRAMKRNAWDMRNRVSFGRDQVLSLSYQRITYVTKYVTKKIGDTDIVPCFYRCSKKLGSNFLDSLECKQCVKANQHYTYLQSGLPCALPRVFTGKMFSSSQMLDFQMDMIFKDCPFEIEDFDTYEEFHTAYKAWYKNKRSKEESHRRKRLLTFQGVRLS